ncbi:uncharacterized protein N7511_003724 [Penicillium nucicola]|uniref:uncharacterized protein n=1 Tax=Penicillium nucicola TaxID=1850975 RepID=UPI0025459E69|nr:uncharacterized protein N7511_003724 [Penicillium nucicola]KAJ5766108.1 hypothetical protein N7511_003724 [Penicillium nucicola]
MNVSEASSSTLSGDGNSVMRSSLQSCNIRNSSIKRCSMNDCVLSNVEYASRSSAKNSTFQDVALLKRSVITDSIFNGRISAKRSTFKKAVIMDENILKRCTITGTTILKSHIDRASLTDCDVTECVVSRSDFKGMILKYGVWKKGVLVGKIGDCEPVAIKMDAAGAENFVPVSVPAPMPTVPQLDSKAVHRGADHPPAYFVDSDVSIDSEDESDNDRDLPPPYKV